MSVYRYVDIMYAVPVEARRGRLTQWRWSTEPAPGNRSGTPCTKDL